MNTEADTIAGLGAVEFRSSRRKTLLLTTGLAAVAALIAYAALTAQSGWWPWLAVAYFGIGAVLVLLNGLFRPATLRLDAEGLHFTHWRHAWSVRWDDIAEVQLIALRINGFKTRENVVVREKSGAKRTVSSGLTTTPAHLAALIRHRHQLALANAPVAPTAEA